MEEKAQIQESIKIQGELVRKLKSEKANKDQVSSERNALFTLPHLFYFRKTRLEAPNHKSHNTALQLVYLIIHWSLSNVISGGHLPATSAHTLNGFRSWMARSFITFWSRVGLWRFLIPNYRWNFYGYEPCFWIRCELRFPPTTAAVCCLVLAVSLSAVRYTFRFTFKYTFRYKFRFAFRFTTDTFIKATFKLMVDDPGRRLLEFKSDSLNLWAELMQ